MSAGIGYTQNSLFSNDENDDDNVTRLLCTEKRQRFWATAFLGERKHCARSEIRTRTSDELEAHRL